MKILVLGAGAVGGYFGGRMAASGSDVTFLVRPTRAKQLERGLQIHSPRGNAVIPVKTVTAGERADSFDVILLSCKSYGLDGALEAISPYVQTGTPILPLLNGFGHLEDIERRFPAAVVWGGTAGIVATMTQQGTIQQMHPNQVITAGARPGRPDVSNQLEALIAEAARAKIDATVSENIELAMWEKWTFLTTLAASTCLMKGATGEILAADYGEELIESLFDECIKTASAEGYPPGPSPAQDYRGMLFDRSLMFTASMLRDMVAGNPTEADHILGDMIRRARRHEIPTPLLNAAYTHLQVYEAQRTSGC